MKCKQLALRVLSTAAVLTIVSSVAAPAFAEAAGIAVYGMYYVDKGSITVSGDSVHYVDETGEHDVEHDDDIIITGTTNKNTVTIRSDEGQNTKVTLDNVNINVSDTGSMRKDNGSEVDVPGKAAMSVTGSGDTTINLKGDNTLSGGKGRAGLEKNDSESTGKMTITAEDTDQKLTVNGGTRAAGIGGREEEGSSNIIISGGKITANGNNTGAGIGGGRRSEGEVTITGGDVTAVGGSYASGIGGGSASAGKVTITGGKVTASSNGYGTAIGGGNGANGAGDITITGGEVNTVWKNGNATTGIGGSIDCTKETTIKITGGTVNAMGTGNAAGIGAGKGDNQTATIEISGDANITAKSAGKTRNNQTGVISEGTGAAIGTAGTTDAQGKEAALDLSSSTGTVIRDTVNHPAGHTEHTWEEISHKDAGIDQLGETVYKCTDADCSATKTEYTPITGHAWNEGVITTEPTCTETGIRTYTCTGCGATKTEVVGALGHAFGEWVPDGKGHKTRTCTRCNETETAVDENYVAPKPDEDPVEKPDEEPTEKPDEKPADEPETKPAEKPDTTPSVDYDTTTSDTDTTEAAPAAVTYAPLRVAGAPAYEQTMADGRVVIAVPAQSASLTGSLHALKELKAKGASVLVFRTQLCESSVDIDALLALGKDADLFTLTHTEGTASLTVAGAEHNDLLK